LSILHPSLPPENNNAFPETAFLEPVSDKL